MSQFELLLITIERGFSVFDSFIRDVYLYHYYFIASIGLKCLGSYNVFRNVGESFGNILILFYLYCYLLNKPYSYVGCSG